jgi:hypothetical protein
MPAWRWPPASFGKAHLNNGLGCSKVQRGQCIRKEEPGRENFGTGRGKRETGQGMRFFGLEGVGTRGMWFAWPVEDESSAVFLCERSIHPSWVPSLFHPPFSPEEEPLPHTSLFCLHRASAPQRPNQDMKLFVNGATTANLCSLQMWSWATIEFCRHFRASRKTCYYYLIRKCSPSKLI